MIVAVPKKTYPEERQIALITQAIPVLTKALMLYGNGKEMVRELIVALKEQQFASPEPTIWMFPAVPLPLMRE